MSGCVVCSIEAAQTFFCCQPDDTVFSKIATSYMIVGVAALVDKLHGSGRQEVDIGVVMEPHSFPGTSYHDEVSRPFIFFRTCYRNTSGSPAVVSVYCPADYKKVSPRFVVEIDVLSCISDLVDDCRILVFKVYVG